MIKIALPSEGDMISQHFGHCPEFTIMDCEGNKVIKKETVVNPGHKPGFLPQFLNELNVEVVLAGGMGSRAVSLFESNGIGVVTGASGQVDKAVELYLSNNLDTEENVCDH